MRVGDRVWIGAGAILLPGVSIGENSVIGAGSVVTHDIPANVVAVGNPCRVLRPITERDRQYFRGNMPIDPALFKYNEGGRRFCLPPFAYEKWVFALLVYSDFWVFMR